MKKIVRWTGWDNQGLEHCQLTKNANEIILEGTVVGNRKSHYGATYKVVADKHYFTKEVWVSYLGGQKLYLTTDSKGNWYDNIQESDLPELEGCLDVDIGVTPATNTLAIKRLKLDQQQAQGIFTAYVPLPAEIENRFLPQKAKQRYTCLIKNEKYFYEGLFRSFSADLIIDEMGLVYDYPDTFRRLSI